MNNRERLNAWILFWSVPAAVCIVGGAVIILILQEKKEALGDYKNILYWALPIVGFVAIFSCYKCMRLIKKLRRLSENSDRNDGTGEGEAKFMKRTAIFFEVVFVLGIISLLASLPMFEYYSEGNHITSHLPVVFMLGGLLVAFFSGALSELFTYGKTAMFGELFLDENGEEFLDLTDYFREKFTGWEPLIHPKTSRWIMNKGAGI